MEKKEVGIIVQKYLVVLWVTTCLQETRRDAPGGCRIGVGNVIGSRKGVGEQTT